MTATDLTRAQHEVLLAPIKGHRVSSKDGLSHVEAYEIRAHLTRVFGFGQWSVEALDVTMLYEQSKEEGSGGPRWRAGYRATVRLTIHATGATYTGAAVGSNFGWLPDSKRDDAHDMAIKTAESQALKRCAINLGDQFGLSLYNKGSLAPLVGRSLVEPTTVGPVPNEAETKGVDAHITAPLAPETPAPQAEPETSTPAASSSDTPAGQEQADDGTDIVAELREKALKGGTKRHLTSLLIEAGKHRVAGALTTDGQGKGMTLETLIQHQIKAAS